MAWIKDIFSAGEHQPEDWLKRMGEDYPQTESKRQFIKGLCLFAAGAALLSVGTLRDLFLFFFGPRLSKEQEAEMMQTRLARTKATVFQRELELERQQSQYILIGALSDLSQEKGKYFIDYEMSPGLAFLGDNGLPTLLSAKCTHLGCTVGNVVDAEGQILCPCHVSYFNIKTGMPNPGAPAKAPLPKLPWVLMNQQGKIIAAGHAGKPTGLTTAEAVKDTNVYIAKTHEELLS